MLCRAYCCSNGDLVLVPDCMLPPKVAERWYGPLAYCGMIDTSYLPANVAGKVVRDVDQLSFSLLPAEMADGLGFEIV